MHVGIPITIFLAAAVLTLSRMGRKWGPPAGTANWVWTSSAQSSVTSQLFADPYSFSHLLHGIIFYYLGRAAGLSFQTSLLVATALECAWEISENTTAVINKYRQETASLGYQGDSILNSVGDIVWMLAGFVLSATVSWQVSVATVLAVELIMLYVYRDNLFLNVLMLLAPSKKIKDWQLRQ